MFYERAGVVFVEGDLQFFLIFHYDGAEPGDQPAESLLSSFLAGVTVC